MAIHGIPAVGPMKTGAFGSAVSGNGPRVARELVAERTLLERTLLEQGEREFSVRPDLKPVGAGTASTARTALNATKMGAAQTKFKTDLGAGSLKMTVAAMETLLDVPAGQLKTAEFVKLGFVELDGSGNIEIKGITAAQVDVIGKGFIEALRGSVDLSAEFEAVTKAIPAANHQAAALGVLEVWDIHNGGSQNYRTVVLEGATEAAKIEAAFKAIDGFSGTSSSGLVVMVAEASSGEPAIVVGKKADIEAGLEGILDAAVSGSPDFTDFSKAVVGIEVDKPVKLDVSSFSGPDRAAVVKALEGAFPGKIEVKIDGTEIVVEKKKAAAPDPNNKTNNNNNVTNNQSSAAKLEAHQKEIQKAFDKKVEDAVAKKASEKLANLPKGETLKWADLGVTKDQVDKKALEKLGLEVTDEGIKRTKTPDEVANNENTEKTWTDTAWEWAPIVMSGLALLMSLINRMSISSLSSSVDAAFDDMRKRVGGALASLQQMISRQSGVIDQTLATVGNMQDFERGLLTKIMPFFTLSPRTSLPDPNVVDGTYRVVSSAPTSFNSAATSFNSDDPRASIDQQEAEAMKLSDEADDLLAQLDQLGELQLPQAPEPVPAPEPESVTVIPAPAPMAQEGPRVTARGGNRTNYQPTATYGGVNNTPPDFLNSND